MQHARWFSGLVAVVTVSTAAALAIGDKAPAFTAKAALDGKPIQFSLQEALRNGPVVVYFYPSAYSNGCNLQAHTFAENHAKFAAAKTTVVGVSLDSVDRLLTFSADPEYCAGKIPVASDPDGAIARAYSVVVRAAEPGRRDTRGELVEHGRAERTTFVIRQDGTLSATITGVTPFENVRLSLEAAEALKAGG